LTNWNDGRHMGSGAMQYVTGHGRTISSSSKFTLRIVSPLLARFKIPGID